MDILICPFKAGIDNWGGVALAVLHSCSLPPTSFFLERERELTLILNLTLLLILIRASLFKIKVKGKDKGKFTFKEKGAKEKIRVGPDCQAGRV